MSTVTDLLRKAWSLIDKTHKWTKGCLARNPLGQRVHIHIHDKVDLNGYSFCVIGALRQAEAEVEVKHDSYHKASSLILEGTEPRSIADWNDAIERTHDDVRVVFEKAIASAEQQGL